MKNLAIIPARGGSKRIPKKNIKNFLGKPILAYSIEAAISSQLFDDIIISTDNKEIAEIGKIFGASVPFYRSEKNSNDFATLIDVLIEVTEHKSISKYDNICCILPTAPFITSNRIKQAYELLVNYNYDSVLPTIEYSYPIQRSLIKNTNGTIEMAYPEYISSRSQDLQKHFHDSGQFYWIKHKTLIDQKTIFSTKCGTIQLSQKEVQDIDTTDDWENAELKFKLIHGIK